MSHSPQIFGFQRNFAHLQACPTLPPELRTAGGSVAGRRVACCGLHPPLLLASSELVVFLFASPGVLVEVLRFFFLDFKINPID